MSLEALARSSSAYEYRVQQLDLDVSDASVGKGAAGVEEVRARMGRADCADKHTAEQRAIAGDAFERQLVAGERPQAVEGGAHVVGSGVERVEHSGEQREEATKRELSRDAIARGGQLLQRAHEQRAPPQRPERVVSGQLVAHDAREEREQVRERRVAEQLERLCLAGQRAK